jgi:hypothetical protein
MIIQSEFGKSRRKMLQLSLWEALELNPLKISLNAFRSVKAEARQFRHSSMEGWNPG